MWLEPGNVPLLRKSLICNAFIGEYSSGVTFFANGTSAFRDCGLLGNTNSSIVTGLKNTSRAMSRAALDRGKFVLSWLSQGHCRKVQALVLSALDSSVIICFQVTTFSASKASWSVHRSLLAVSTRSPHVSKICDNRSTSTGAPTSDDGVDGDVDGVAHSLDPLRDSPGDKHIFPADLNGLEGPLERRQELLRRED